MNENMEAMEQAAAEAAKELTAKMNTAQVGEWVAKWYMKAGYKRLAKLLIAFSKNAKTTK